MADVTAGIAALPAADVDALATYVMSFLPPAPSGNAAAEALAKNSAYGPTRTTASTRAADQPGAAIFAATCATCHHGGGGLPAMRPAPLALSTALQLGEPTNAVRVVMGGIPARPGTPGAIMPPFGDTLTDRQLADVVTYLRKQFTDRPDWTNVADTIAGVRKEDAGALVAEGHAP
jgi:mono/diheme cytochrome c family protein